LENVLVGAVDGKVRSEICDLQDTGVWAIWKIRGFIRSGI
jgi:hypothetical protein